MTDKLSSWNSFFENFFEENKENIGNIIYASGVREAWIQGQMFLEASHDEAFKTEFVPAYNSASKNSKFDIFGTTPNLMVAEMKVISVSDNGGMIHDSTKKDIDTTRFNQLHDICLKNKNSENKATTEISDKKLKEAFLIKDSNCLLKDIYRLSERTDEDMKCFLREHYYSELNETEELIINEIDPDRLNEHKDWRNEYQRVLRAIENNTTIERHMILIICYYDYDEENTRTRDILEHIDFSGKTYKTLDFNEHHFKVRTWELPPKKVNTIQL